MEQRVISIINKQHALAFKIRRRFLDTLLIILLLVATFLVMALTHAHAQGIEEVVLYEENFNDNQAQDWKLGQGWEVTDAMLSGSGHEWATCTAGEWSDSRVNFQLRLLEEESTIHLNYRLSEKGRYYIGFNADGLYLSKEAPWGTFHEYLAKSSVSHSYNTWYNVEIIGEGTHIQIAVEGEPEIDYNDPEPLLSGTIAFETLEGAVAQVDDIIVTGPLPDLSILSTGYWFEDNEEVLVLFVEIENKGNNRAPATQVFFEDRELDWLYEYNTIQALDPEDTVSVEIRMDIPEELRGTIRTFRVEVDPENAVREIEENNNEAMTRGIPLPPLDGDSPLPDFSILSTDYWFEDNEEVLVLFVEIENKGNNRAPATQVFFEDRELDWLYEYNTIQALDPEDTVSVEIRMDIPEELRGTIRTFRVEVDPENAVREIDENNNEAMTTGIPLPLLNDELPLFEVVVILGAIGGIALIISRTITIRRRNEWQEKAGEEEPLQTCKPCTHYCRKIELELEPALRKITYLSFGVSDPISGEQSKERQVKGELVAGLNTAVMAHHRRETPEKLLEQVAPLAHALLQQIMEWLRVESASKDVFVTGHLEGGKVTCQFILYHCKRRGTVDVWAEEEKWKATIRSEHVEFVGTLQGMEPAEFGIPEQIESDLTWLLKMFIEKV